MAIGDPVGLGKRRPETWVQRFDATDGPAALERDLLKAEVFEAEFARSPLKKLVLALMLRVRRDNRGLRLKPRKFGILALADRVNDVFRAGAGPAMTSVEIPYAHLALAAGFPIAGDPTDYAENLRIELQERWKPYLDPVVGVRVELYRDPDRSDNHLSLFLGRGIFLPERDEKPIGSVEIALADGSGDSTQPCLADERPAGLYRGQNALVFADAPARAPAFCRLLNDPHHIYVMQFVPSSTWRGDRTSGGIHLTLLPTGRVGPDDARPDVKAMPPPPGYDAAFKILRDGSDYLTVRVLRDRRISALRQAPPAAGAPVLELVGILVPDRQLFGREIDRWWIDLDDNDLLVSGASVSVAKSLIFSDRSVEAYDWRTNRFRIGSDPAVRFESCQFGGRERTVVRLRSERPLGFLLPPPVRQAIGFDGIRGGDSAYYLDWLDYAGAIDPLFGGSERLAAAFAGSVAEPKAAQVPSAAEVAQMAPGAELFVGPLRVRTGGRL
jgi:hypothetical protein